MFLISNFVSFWFLHFPLCFAHGYVSCSIFFSLFVYGMFLWSYFNKINKLITRKFKMNFCLWHVFIDLHERSKNNWPCEKFVFFKPITITHLLFLLGFLSSMCMLLQGVIWCAQFWPISLVPTLMWNYLKNSSSNVLNNENHLVW